MSTQPTLVLAHRGWLRSLRLLTILSLLLFLLTIVAVAVDREERDIALAIVCFAPWVLCCLVVLWLIKGNPPKKSGVALAVGVSSFAWILSIPISLRFEDLLIPTMGYQGLFAIAQVGMAGSAIKTYYSLNREAGDIRRLAEVCAIPVIILALIGLVIPDLTRRGYAAPESSAGSSVRTVGTANVTYSETYKQGFAGTLAQLGPPSEACSAVSSSCADLLDFVLSGVNPATATPVKSGYRFTYVAPNPAPTLDQPNATLSMTATPVSPGRSGTSTFCVDQTNEVLRDTSGRMKTGAATGCGWPIGGTVGPP